MRIGLDLDNTIICYDSVFYRVATDMGLLRESGLTEAATKTEVKAWVQATQGNDVWTELQGEVYGPALHLAHGFPDALEFLHDCLSAGHHVCILSHKTQFPAIGKRVDLREAALNWLVEHGWIGPEGLSRNEVEFHDSRAAKVAAIARRNCDLFVDDLPEVFEGPGFPRTTSPVLFGGCAPSTLFPGISHWADLRKALAKGPLAELAGELLRGLNLPQPRLVLPLAGGRNNKVYRVCTAAGDFLFKAYFHSPEEKRDRLRQEFDFLHHLFRVAPGISPKPLAVNYDQHVSLMEFIPGQKLTQEQVNEHHVRLAIQFFLGANQELDALQTLALPPAAEACFSLAEHLEKTQNRVSRLSHILVDDEVDLEAKSFIDYELLPGWNHISGHIAKSVDAQQSQAILPQTERCLSPSDFGFHNAILQASGPLRFLDFEYAGWDDPAKLIIDFANQPDMLLDPRLSHLFREAVIQINAAPSALERRVQLLEPVYQLKWACICLNSFLAFGRKKLLFKDEAGDNRSVRVRQLAKARIMLARTGIRN